MPNEDALKCERNSGVGPAAFGATARATRKTKNGSLSVDLIKPVKSRTAVETIRKALVEKLGEHVVSI